MVETSGTTHSGLRGTVLMCGHEHPDTPALGHPKALMQLRGVYQAGTL